MSFIDILTQGFMLRALYGATLVSLLCGTLGVFVTLRRQSFLTDGIAHASLTGIAIGLLLSFAPIYTAMVVAILMAIGITYVRRTSDFSFDVIIAIFYSIFFAIGVAVIYKYSQFTGHIDTYLLGSTATITWSEVILTLVVLVVSLGIISFNYKRVVYMTFDYDGAYLRGVNTKVLDYMLNILTSIAVIVAVKLVGVVLVTALMIIPATSAKLLARKFNQLIPLTLFLSLILTLAGVIIAHFIQLPSGATIVIAQGSGLAFIYIVARVFK